MAIMNTEPEAASAQLLHAVFKQSLYRGRAASAPRLVQHSLQDTFVDPALAFLQAKGCEIHLARPVKALAVSEGKLQGFTSGHDYPLGSDDALVLAVPSWAAAELVPGLVVPQSHRPIINLHFKLDQRPKDAAQITGIIGGLAQWVFLREGLASVTISAAGDHDDADKEGISDQVWDDLTRALGLAGPKPPYRLIREKRATFAATPQNQGQRPGPRGPYKNLLLAGDWTATGLPSTIEGAIRSGAQAAKLLLS